MGGRIAKELEDKRAEREKLNQLIWVLEELEDVDASLVRLVWSLTYSKQVSISPSEPAMTRKLLRAIQTEVRVPIAKKAFDEGTGKLEYHIKVKNGWTITVSGGDPACEIEEVTTEVWVEPKGGYNRTVTRFRLKDPEKCYKRGVDGEMSPFEGEGGDE